MKCKVCLVAYGCKPKPLQISVWSKINDLNFSIKQRTPEKQGIIWNWEFQGC